MAFLISIIYVLVIGYELANFSFFNNSIDLILISNILALKPKRLKKLEKLEFTLTNELKEILIGLILGDLFIRRKGINRDTSLQFKQGVNHQDYIYHLFTLFEKYCPSQPKIVESLPDIRTGNIYISIIFSTYTLPCFNDFYNLFYKSNKKIIPINIGNLLTPLSLVYWICDDGSWNKVGRYITLCTDSFSLLEVELLIDVLNKKFNLKCYKVRNGKNYRIIIPAYSISVLHELLSQHTHFPPMMISKIRFIIL